MFESVHFKAQCLVLTKFSKPIILVNAPYLRAVIVLSISYTIVVLSYVPNVSTDLQERSNKV